MGYGAGAMLGLSGLGLPGCAKQDAGLRVANWQQVGDDSDLAKTLREIYDQFEHDHKVDLQIESQPGGSEYVQKLLLSFIAGSEPDVMQLDASSAASFVDNGVFGELPKSGNGFYWEDYYRNTVEIGEREGKKYAVPLDYTPMVLYYNKAHFAEAGLKEPKGQWLWDEFLDAAKALTRDGRYGFSFANWMPGWVMWLWNGMGDVLGEVRGREGYWASGHFDADTTVAAVEWLRDLITKWKVAPSLSQAAALGVDPFAGGRASMTVSGHWSMVGYKASKDISLDDVGVAKVPVQWIPVNPGGFEPSTVIYESGLAIGKNCKRKELAWEYVRMMTSKEVQERLQRTGLAVCARVDVAEELARGDEREEMFLEIGQYGRAPWGSIVEGYDYVEAEGQKAMDAILKTGADVRTTLRAAAADIDSFFEQKRGLR